MAIDRSKDGKLATFSNSYSARMLNDVSGIIEEFREEMRGVKYDTLVGRGSSGMLIIPQVARALRKHYFIVRKPEEAQAAHSNIGYLGTLGRRWVFFDDFVSTGETFMKVRDGVKDAVRQINNYPRERWDMDKGCFVKVEEPPFETELVGLFEYTSRGNGWSPWDEKLRLKDWSERYCFDMPGTFLTFEQRMKALGIEGY